MAGKQPVNVPVNVNDLMSRIGKHVGERSHAAPVPETVASPTPPASPNTARGEHGSVGEAQERVVKSRKLVEPKVPLPEQRIEEASLPKVPERLVNPVAHKLGLPVEAVSMYLSMRQEGFTVFKSARAAGLKISEGRELEEEVERQQATTYKAMTQEELAQSLLALEPGDLEGLADTLSNILRLVEHVQRTPIALKTYGRALELVAEGMVGAGELLLEPDGVEYIRAAISTVTAAEEALAKQTKRESGAKKAEASKDAADEPQVSARERRIARRASEAAAAEVEQGRAPDNAPANEGGRAIVGEYTDGPFWLDEIEDLEAEVKRRSRSSEPFAVARSKSDSMTLPETLALAVPTCLALFPELEQNDDITVELISKVREAKSDYVAEGSSGDLNQLPEEKEGGEVEVCGLFIDFTSQVADEQVRALRLHVDVLSPADEASEDGPVISLMLFDREVLASLGYESGEQANIDYLYRGRGDGDEVEWGYHLLMAGHDAVDPLLFAPSALSMAGDVALTKRQDWIVLAQGLIEHLAVNLIEDDGDDEADDEATAADGVE